VARRLVADFVAGRAQVEPARDACNYCHLHGLCRIADGGGAVQEERDAPEDDGD
jgi:hypothetical protein